MNVIFDLYGIKMPSLTSAKLHIETILGIYFEERDSLYEGGIYYSHKSTSAENLLLKVNIDPFDDVPAEQDFPEYKILLYVNESTQSSDLAEQLERYESIKLLRHELFDTQL